MAIPENVRQSMIRLSEKLNDMLADEISMSEERATKLVRKIEEIHLLLEEDSKNRKA